MIGGWRDDLAEPQDASVGKRVVLEMQDGTMIIIGMAWAQPPDVICPLEDQTVAFSLREVTARMYIYRQVMELRTGKLGEFHPQQK